MDENLAAMGVFMCFRYEDSANDWMGALLIAAPDEATACLIYEREQGDMPPQVRLMTDVWASGTPRILYNDELR